MASRTAAPKPSVLERWARFTHRRRGTVIGGWVVMSIVLVFGMVQFGGEFSSDFSLPGSESQKAFDILEENYPARAGAEADLIFEDARGIDDPAVRTVVDRTIAELLASEHIAEIESPYDNPTYISEDGTIGRSVELPEWRARTDRLPNTTPAGNVHPGRIPAGSDP